MLSVVAKGQSQNNDHQARCVSLVHYVDGINNDILSSETFTGTSVKLSGNATSLTVSPPSSLGIIRVMFTQTLNYTSRIFVAMLSLGLFVLFGASGIR